MNSLPDAPVHSGERVRVPRRSAPYRCRTRLTIASETPASAAICFPVQRWGRSRSIVCTRICDDVGHETQIPVRPTHCSEMIFSFGTTRAVPIYQALPRRTGQSHDHARRTYFAPATPGVPEPTREGAFAFQSASSNAGTSNVPSLATARRYRKVRDHKRNF